MCDMRNCMRLGTHHTIQFKGQEPFEVCEFHFDSFLGAHEVQNAESGVFEN